MTVDAQFSKVCLRRESRGGFGNGVNSVNSSICYSQTDTEILAEIQQKLGGVKVRELGGPRTE